MIKPVLTILGIFLLWTASSQQKYSILTDRAVTLEQLKGGFSNPPAEAGLRCYWWWLNSMVTKESITSDLEEMKAKGYGGAIIFDAGTPPGRKKIQAGPVFMGPEWMKLYQHAVKEDDRLNLELSINVQSGWNPGAPTIVPELAQKKLVFTETEVAGGKPIQIDLPHPKTNLTYGDVIIQAIPLHSRNAPLRNDAITNWDKKSFTNAMGWQGIYPLHELRGGFESPVNADIIHKNDMINLTTNFDGKQLRWNAPEGDWLVI